MILSQANCVKLHSFKLPEIYFIEPRLLGKECKPIIIRDAYGAPRVYPPLAGKPVALLSLADLLRERRNLVVRHPDQRGRQ